MFKGIRTYLAILVVFLTLPSLLTICPAVANASETVPNLSSPAYSYQNPFYNSGYWGQCTWFSWGRAKEKIGVSLPFRGNASAWWTDYSSQYVHSATPASNSIAVWSGGCCGHVGFVEQISGSNVVLNEANWNTYSSGGGYDGSAKTLTIAQMQNRGAYHLLGYIYLGSSTTPSTVRHETTTVGLYDPATATFYLRNSNDSGKADLTFLYGNGGNWIPIKGDWNGDGTTTVGLYDPATATFYLRNSNNSGKADLAFLYGGNSNWISLAGDWNGDGTTTIGLYDPATATFYLRNSNDSGKADITFLYGGNSNWLPLAGDWNGDGITTVGLYDPAQATFYLRNSNNAGKADLTFLYGGSSNWIPLNGDWNGDGTTTIGLYDPAQATFYLRNSNTSGKADLTFLYGGNSNWIPTNTFTRPAPPPVIPPAQLDLPLSLEFGGARWASYADYLARELSVDYTITNVGVNNAYAVNITGSSNTAGVTVASTLPMVVGDISAGNNATVVLGYTVPVGVSHFRTTLTASAKDVNRNTHMYP